MILAMSLKVSVNGFWSIAFVNKNATLYTKLSPYCAISNGNEVLNSIISDSFESDNNGKFLDIPKSFKPSIGDETVDVSGYLRPKKEKWFQVKEQNRIVCTARLFLLPPARIPVCQKLQSVARFRKALT